MAVLHQIRILWQDCAASSLVSRYACCAAAVRSSSAASDPTHEKLECFLDHRSLLGMLQQRAAPQEESIPPNDPRHPLVLHPQCRLDAGLVL